MLQLDNKNQIMEGCVICMAFFLAFSLDISKKFYYNMDEQIFIHK